MREFEAAAVPADKQAGFLSVLTSLVTVSVGLARAALQLFTGTYSSICRPWTTGLQVLDKAIGGIGQGIFLIIAETACFKTYLVMVISLANVLAGRRVFFAECEIGPWRVLMRYLAMTGLVVCEEIKRTPDIFKTDDVLAVKFTTFLGRLGGRLILLDTGQLQILRHEHGVNDFCLAIFNMSYKELLKTSDEILLLIDSANKFPSNFREAKARLENLLANLEVITMQPNIRVVLVCELTKGKGPRSKINLTDIKDSVEPGYAASKIIALQREQPTDDAEDKLQPVEITVTTLKDRDGILNKPVTLHFNPKSERFDEVDDFSSLLTASSIPSTNHDKKSSVKPRKEVRCPTYGGHPAGGV